MCKILFGVPPWLMLHLPRVRVTHSMQVKVFLESLKLVLFFWACRTYNDKLTFPFVYQRRVEKTMTLCALAVDRTDFSFLAFWMFNPYFLCSSNINIILVLSLCCREILPFAVKMVTTQQGQGAHQFRHAHLSCFSGSHNNLCDQFYSKVQEDDSSAIIDLGTGIWVQLLWEHLFMTFPCIHIRHH